MRKSLSRLWPFAVLGLVSGVAIMGDGVPLKAVEEKPPEFEWIGEDLVGAREKARKTGKPLLVLFRCPP